jgi:hypothetical protein
VFDFNLFSKREWALMVIAFAVVALLSLYGFFRAIDHFVFIGM